jgi:hypothetical protein
MHAPRLTMSVDLCMDRACAMLCKQLVTRAIAPNIRPDPHASNDQEETHAARIQLVTEGRGC